MQRAKSLIKRVLRPLSSRWIYTARRGLTKGMRRRGGFDFLPWRKPFKEEELLYFLAPQMQGKVVFDIGANIGLVTLFFARHVGNEGRVVAFEPIPYLYKWLCEHVRLNQLKNVTCLQIALGAEKEQKQIYYSRDRLGIGTLDPQIADRYKGKLTTESTQVAVMPLDECIYEYHLPEPNLIKIDVEGFEFQVLQGVVI